LLSLERQASRRVEPAFVMQDRPAPAKPTMRRKIADTIGGDAVVASGASSTVNATSVAILRTDGSGLVASGVGSSMKATKTLVTTTGSSGALVSGAGATVSLVTSKIASAGTHGALVTGAGAGFFMTGASSISEATIDGVRAIGADQTVLVEDSLIERSNANGVTVASGAGSTTTQVTLLRSTINQSGGIGVDALGVNGATEVVQIFGTRIGTSGVGVSAFNSNVDIGRDTTVRGGLASSITNSDSYGVFAEGNSRVRVTETTISGADVGIAAINELFMANAFRPEFLQISPVKKMIRIPRSFAHKSLRPYHMPLIEMSPALQAELDYESKLDRSAAQMRRLMADGAAQAEIFLQARRPVPDKMLAPMPPLMEPAEGEAFRQDDH
jgi:hypothetical protein